MKAYIDKTALVAEIERIREHVKRLRYAVDANCMVTVRNTCECLESSIDLLVNSINILEMKEANEEPVSNDLEEAAKNYEEDAIFYAARRISDFFKAGAKWQKTKACEWLKEHKEHPLIGCEDPCLSGYLTNEFIEDFKKAMEE